MTGTEIVVLIGAYLIGSIPAGLLAGKLRGIDIRKHGSGNIGATNVVRTLGKGMGISVFVFDFLKGMVPVLLAKQFVGASGWIPILAAILAILGHNYPVWLKFKGGKGIATSAGALAGLLPWALLVAVVVFGLTFALSRYVSVASVATAASLPITTAILTYRSSGLTSPLLIFTLIIAALAIWRHRANIQRLRAGTEHRFTPRSRS